LTQTTTSAPLGALSGWHELPARAPLPFARPGLASAPSAFRAAMSAASSASSARRSGSAASTACSALVASPVTCAAARPTARRALVQTEKGRYNIAQVAGKHTSEYRCAGWKCAALWAQAVMTPSNTCVLSTTSAGWWCCSSGQTACSACRRRLVARLTGLCCQRGARLLLHVQDLAVGRDALDLARRERAQEGRFARACARAASAEATVHARHPTGSDSHDKLINGRLKGRTIAPDEAVAPAKRQHDGPVLHAVGAHVIAVRAPMRCRRLAASRKHWPCPQHSDQLRATAGESIALATARRMTACPCAAWHSINARIYTPHRLSAPTAASALR